MSAAEAPRLETVGRRLLLRYPYVLAGSACLGLAVANAGRVSGGVATLAVMAAAAAAAVVVADPRARVAALALALLLAGWWWGSARLDALDTSLLADHVGETETAALVVTGPARNNGFELRIPARMIRFGRVPVGEPVLLELPVGRSPPQGAILEVDVRLKLPRPPSDGFDERTWLRRHGVHVVALGKKWRIVGHRGGLGGYADRIRAWLAGSLAPGLTGERHAVLEGIVLGEDEGLSPELRDAFRTSGLYHLLAVSGQNVIFVAAGILGLAWVVGVPRWLGELGALAGIGSYVLAVGAQPSVIRAGIAGALGSIAWLTARQRDRWHFLLVGALLLLAWNPYALLDAGFQLSFAAVVAIFLALPRAQRLLEGYPVPKLAGEAVSVSLACGLATAPVLWLQFGRIPLYSVPANALAAPVVGPLLGLSFAAAIADAISPAAAGLIASANGCLAAYLAWCARFVGGLPGAVVSSSAGVGGLLLIGSSLTILAVGGADRYRRRP
ncbi:MAG TPA: ComEC/Rec2 family competence protein [Gaiellaceae bacterium]